MIINDWIELIKEPTLAVLMGYLVDQGRIQSLTPGQLTQWRVSDIVQICVRPLADSSLLCKNFMYSHVSAL
jgi:hypothetical protein